MAGCFIFNYSPPPSLESIIIWAKKYCFYLGFQTLRGNKALKAHILVLFFLSATFTWAFWHFAAASARATSCWHWLTHSGASWTHSWPWAWGSSFGPRAICIAADPEAGGRPSGIPLGGKLTESWNWKSHSGQVRLTLKPPGPKSVIFVEKIAKLFILSNNQMIRLSPAYPAMLF